MTADEFDQDTQPDQIHQGHRLETGLLQRLREWVDVFPWIRLGRTLRVAGSPPLLALVAITMAVWWLIHGAALELGSPILVSPHPQTLQGWLFGILSAGHLWLIQSMPISIFDAGNLKYQLIAIGLFLLLWTPVALVLLRQGALLTAGRNMMGLGPVLRLAVRRTPAAWLAAIVPAVCVLMFGVLLVLIALAGRLGEDLVEWQIFLGIVAAILAIPGGVLLFGGVVAVPLAWAAIVNERDPDALDALSRGYEYLYRRPLRVAMYAVVTIVVLLVAFALAQGVAAAAMTLAAAMMPLAGAPLRQQHAARDILQAVPAIVVAAMWWALIGGVYLLLRYDAGGQEVEDLWQPPPPPQPSMPSLPMDA